MPELKFCVPEWRDGYTGAYVPKELPTVPDVRIANERTGVPEGSVLISSVVLSPGTALRVTSLRFNAEGSGAKGKLYIIDSGGLVDAPFLESEGSEKQLGRIEEPLYVLVGTVEVWLVSYGTGYTYGVFMQGYYSR